jgi:hypothetical protein
MEFVDSLIKLLNQGWVGTTVGFISIAIALVIYRLSRPRPTLAYQTRGIRLLGHNSEEIPSGVEVRFHGRVIPRLTKSFVVVWNAGQKTFISQDLVASDPLRFEFGADAELLSVSVTRTSRDVTGVRHVISPENPHQVELAFDFLDPGDGAVIEVLHTGSTRYPAVGGTIMGLPQGLSYFGIANDGSIRTPLFRVPRKYFSVVMIIFGFYFAASPYFPTFYETANKTLPPSIVMALGAAYSAFGAALLWRSRRRYPRRLHCDDLE